VTDLDMIIMFRLWEIEFAILYLRVLKNENNKYLKKIGSIYNIYSWIKKN
jgi:hypothetical protein